MQKLNKEKGNILIIAALAVVILVIIGVVLWRVFLPTAKIPSFPVGHQADSQTQALENQSTSDEVAAIEKDVADTQLDKLDEELPQIEKEIQ